MGNVDYGILSQELAKAATDIMHHQTKLDVFIIRAYKLFSTEEGIIDNRVLQNVSASQSPSEESESTGKISKPTSTKNGSVTVNANQYLQMFSKISKLYNATISSGSVEDRSTSPKSAIELCQRFQQIIRELELSYDVSPYNKYIQKIDNGIWKVKDDATLKDDKFWEVASMSIGSIYDPRSGQILSPQMRRRPSSMVNSLSAPTKESTSTIHRNPTIGCTTTDSSLPQQLQKKLQNLSQDTNSRSLTGYHTQPTSPGHGGFSFGLSDSDTFYNSFTGVSATGVNGVPASSKRRSLGSLGADALGDEAVEELLQLTNTSKRQRTALQQQNPLNGFETGTGSATETPSISHNPIAAASSLINGEEIVRQLKNTYENLVSEKDRRIVYLERELELQRQETHWLRKMLIEDMGCVRSLLKDLKN